MCIRDSARSVEDLRQHGLRQAFDRQQVDQLAVAVELGVACLLYTSDAADERSSVDLGGRRIIKKKKWRA